LVVLACSAPPEGREHWSMQLLAGKLVKLSVVETIPDETVRCTLKKQGEAALARWAVPRHCA
jgi:hypothetical protein